MTDITDKVFETAFIAFNEITEKEISKEKSEFKNLQIKKVKDEHYKYEILNNVKNLLLTKTWKENDIGSGRILDCVKKSIDVGVNLIWWTKKDDFKNLEVSRGNEKLFFDFFKTKISDENAFNQFCETGFKYQLIAYLFFIKNPQKYMPISQEYFDKVFNSLGINLRTSNNCSWENYLEYNEIIKQFKQKLSNIFLNVSLLDAHSFLFIYGDLLNKEKEQVNNQKEISNQENKHINSIHTPNPQKELEIHQPKKIVNVDNCEKKDNENIDTDNFAESSNEIDWIEKLKKQIEKGKKAEEFVLKNEKDFLNENYPELAIKVKSVSNNLKNGFDILSFETDGKQKQIEVKAISTNKEKKSFFISQNEFEKSKKLPNYYVYCVCDIDSENARTVILKNPNFGNEDEFKVEPFTYKITFE